MDSHNLQDKIFIENTDNLDNSNQNNIDNKYASESIMNVNHCPIKCPVNRCKQIIGITSILGHFLRDHKQKFPIDFNEITSNKRRSVLSFYPSIFPCNDIICLGIIAYGGNNSEERPATLGICTKNMFLPENYLHLINHLPIVIFGCKTTICDMFKNRKLASKLNIFCTENEEIYVIWLTTINTTKSIFCTLTAFDENRHISRSTTHEVRKITSKQNLSEFLSNSSNYMWLSNGEIKNLSNCGKTPVQIEIYIQMYDKLNE